VGIALHYLARNDVGQQRLRANPALIPAAVGFTLSVSLDLHAPHLSANDAMELMARAHERCPYSNATRGNIDVQLTVDGAPLGVQVAEASSAN
jgi:lipoyl-dependent peroxiredoxin